MSYAPKGLLVVVLASAMIITSCNGGQKKETVTHKPVVKDEPVHSEYMKEGFISPELYRVVITTSEESCDQDQEMEKRARARAFSSLRNLILSKRGSLPPNCNARLQSMIQESGTFIVRKKGCPGSRVYNFDINRPGLKQSVQDLIRGR